MTPEELVYLTILAASIPVGFLFRYFSEYFRNFKPKICSVASVSLKRVQSFMVGGDGRIILPLHPVPGPGGKQGAALLLGLLFTVATCQVHTLHSLVTVIGTWVIIKSCWRFAPTLSLAWTFLYLLFFRLADRCGLPSPTPFANAIQLLLTLKMVSLANDVHSFHVEKKKEVSSFGASPAAGGLSREPSLYDLLSYSYCYIGIMTGPFFRFKTFSDWLQQPSRGGAARLGAVPAAFEAGARLRRSVPGRQLPVPAGLRPHRRLSGSHLFFPVLLHGCRVLRVSDALLRSVVRRRGRLHQRGPGLLPGEGCVQTGRRTLRQLQVLRLLPPPHRPTLVLTSRLVSSPDPAADHKYDFRTIQNIDCYNTDFCVKVRHGMRYWNMTVQWWLHHYVYANAPFRSYTLRAGWTMLISAYWHGLHAGYYLSFLTIPLCMAAESAMEASVRAKLGPRGQAVFDWVHWFLKMRAYDYMCMGFVLLKASDTIDYWASVYFNIHAIAVCCIMDRAAGQGPTETGGPAAVTGNGRLGDQQSLRSRRPSSRLSSQSPPQLNWGSALTGDDEDDGPPQDLRSRPLPMSQRRALWQEQQKKVPVVSKGESWRRKNAKLLREGKEALKEILYFFSPWRKALQLIGVLLECMNYNPNPQGLVPFYTYILDVLLGTGFVELSYLFYGFYENTVVEDRNFYNIPLAYLLTAAFYFAFCLICIVVRLGYAARVAVATGGQTGGEYSMIAFAGWDYGSLGDKETKLKQKNILYRLQVRRSLSPLSSSGSWSRFLHVFVSSCQVDLEEERLKNQAAALTLKQKVFLYSLRVLLLFLALGLIAAALFGIFQATQFSQKMSGREGIVGLLIQYLPSIVITAGNFVVPLLCDQIALLERYSPSVTIILALMRAVVLRLVGLGVLLFTLWTQVTCGGNPEEDDCRLCQYNYKLYQVNLLLLPETLSLTASVSETSSSSSSSSSSCVSQCWETRVGQEMYKLTVFDLLIAVATLVLVEFPRRMVVDHSSNALVQKLGRQEFVIPSNVLVLVYGQTVVWTGALFCPLLPLINTVKFIILFYCKKITLFHNCRPALRTFRSTTSTFFFLVVLLFGWGLATTVMVYSVTAIHPSMSCGPFRFFDNMWLIVPATLYSLSDTSRDFLFFIGSQAFSIPLFILLCVVLCYFIALASVYGKTVRLLRTQLKLVS
ncbi:unnamed protein product, partial [Tetraodon nigroviridis]